MLAWKAIYGSFLAVSPVGPQIRWWDPHLVDILWSSRNGLFSDVADPLPRRDRPARRSRARGRRSACRRCSRSRVMIYFNASIQDWWGSAGFRRTPLRRHAAAVRARRRARRSRPRAACSRAPRLVGARRARGRGGLERRRCVRPSRDGQVRSASRCRSAKPAPTRRASSTAGSAIRSPIRPASGSRRGTASRRPTTTCRDLVHGRGDPPVRTHRHRRRRPRRSCSPAGSRRSAKAASRFRWATQQAALTVPLAFASDLDLQLRLRAFPMPGDGQTVTVDTAAGRFGPLAVGTEWQTLVVAIPRAAWRAGAQPDRADLLVRRASVQLRAAATHRDLSAAIDFVRVEGPRLSRR